ncbi:GH32 C-terminal domain-containing protein [Burkholderia ambifaria]
MATSLAKSSVRIHSTTTHLINPSTIRPSGPALLCEANGDVGTWIFYDTASQTLTLDGSRCGNIRFSNAFSKQHIVNMPLENGKLRLTVLVDRNSVEVFTGDGRTVITDLIFPAPDDNRVSVFSDNGEATFSDMTITRLADSRGAKQ